MMYWYGTGMSGWGYALMTISLILFWGALIAGGVALFRYFARGGAHRADESHAPPPQQQSAERLLAERYARGEIDDEEYHRRLAALRAAGHGAAPGDGQARPPAGTSAR